MNNKTLEDLLEIEIISAYAPDHLYDKIRRCIRLVGDYIGCEGGNCLRFTPMIFSENSRFDISPVEILSGNYTDFSGGVKTIKKGSVPTEMALKLLDILECKEEVLKEIVAFNSKVGKLSDQTETNIKEIIRRYKKEEDE